MPRWPSRGCRAIRATGARLRAGRRGTRTEITAAGYERLRAACRCKLVADGCALLSLASTNSHVAVVDVSVDITTESSYNHNRITRRWPMGIAAHRNRGSSGARPAGPALAQGIIVAAGVTFLMTASEELWKRFVPRYIEALGAP